MTCKKHSPGKPCCNNVSCTECGLIAEEDLPAIAIAGYTGSDWSATSSCCWTKEFTPDEPQDWEFTDGGPLQVDGWTVVENYEYSWLKISRGFITVAGKILRQDSGGPYTPVDVGDAAWRTTGFAYVVDPYPACPTCQGKELCVSARRTSNYEYMQRWGVSKKLEGITVSLQKILTSCGADGVPTCKYVMSSKTRYLYATYFQLFMKQHVTVEFSKPLYGCCDLPADTDVLYDYPDFYDPLSYTAPGPTLVHEIVSVKILSSLSEQDIGFGINICDDCVPSSVGFCLGDCVGEESCLVTEGTGDVIGGPFGHIALCDTMDPIECTRTTEWGVVNAPSRCGGLCLWGAYFTWSDGQVDCIKAQFGPDPDGTNFLRDDRQVRCNTTWVTYSFSGSGCLGGVPPDSNNFGIPFGSDGFNGSIDPLIGNGCPVPQLCGDCDDSFPDPQRIGRVGELTELSYTPYCSGPIEQTYCFDNPSWTVSILPTAPGP